MRTTTITPGEERYPAALYLGRVGENLTRQIVFGCSALAEECGAGVAEIVAMTPEGTKYAPANVTQEGSTVTWLISEADVGTAGRGRAELSWIVGDGVAKTITWQTLIRASLTGTDGEDPPDVYKDWVDKITRVGTQATTDAQSAAASAQAAADSAEGAAGSAAGAGERAGAAEQSAQKAETAAQTATEQAGKAQTSEESAQRSATEASQSATTATDKAAEAAQSATTATDKAAEAAQSAQAAQQAQAAAETAQGKAEASATAAGESAQAAAESAETAGETALGAYVCKTAEGTVVSFDDGADGLPLKSCVVQIEPIQEGEGDPSPDNVRPIKGWTGCEVQRRGKNLLAPTLYSGCTYNPAVGSHWKIVESSSRLVPVSVDAYKVDLGTWATRTFLVPVRSGVTYHLKIEVSGTDVATTFGWLSADFEVLYAHNRTGAEIVVDSTITPSAGQAYAYFLLAPRVAAQTLTIKAPQLEIGTTATDYEPYQATTYPISWEAEAGTVYGGELDLTEGLLTSTLDADGNPLEEPLVYQLTPTEVRTLLGANNIWADTGDVSVEYRADPTILYNKLTNAIISMGGNV